MAMSKKAAHVRSRIAVKRRYEPDADVTDLQRDFKEAKAEQYIEQLLASAPPLTNEQRQRLADLLAPTDQQ